MGAQEPNHHFQYGFYGKMWYQPPNSALKREHVEQTVYELNLVSLSFIILKQFHSTYYAPLSWCIRLAGQDPVAQTT